VSFPKRVLMIIDHVNDGGAQQYLKRLSNELNERTITVTVCSLQPSKAVEPVVRSTSFETVFLSEKRFNIRTFFLLLRLVKIIRPDIVHTHLTGSNLIGVIAAKLGGVSRIFTHDHSGAEYTHRFPIISKLVLIPLERMTIHFVSKIFAVSNHVATFNINIKKFPLSKVVVLPNWVDAADFRFSAENRDRIRTKYGIPKTSIVVGAAGRLSPEKGLLTLVDAFADVVKFREDAHLVIAGEGPQRCEIESRIRNLNLSGRAHLMGHVPDAPSVYSVFDIFVLPSHYETFGIALLEAMYCGLPVIASNIGGIPDLIKPEVNGVLVDPENPDQLSLALVQLLLDKPKRERLGMCARSDATTQFSKAVLVDKLVDYYSAS